MHSKFILKILIGLVLVVTFLAMAIIFWANNSEKQTASYKKAVEYIRDDPPTKEYIGEIKEISFLISSKVSEKRSGEGEAYYRIPITGTKNDIMAEISLIRDSKGDWEIVDYKFY